MGNSGGSDSTVVLGVCLINHFQNAIISAITYLFL